MFKRYCDRSGVKYAASNCHKLGYDHLIAAPNFTFLQGVVSIIIHSSCCASGTANLFQPTLQVHISHRSLDRQWVPLALPPKVSDEILTRNQSA